MTLAGDIELTRLVDLASERLGVNIDYNPKDLSATVTLRLGGGVTDDELWALTNRLLAARDLTTVQMPGDHTLSVVKASQAASVATIEASDSDGGAAGFRTVVVRAAHVDVAVLAQTLKPLLSREAGAVAAVGDTGLLLLSDFEPRLEQVLTMLPDIDVASPSVELHTVRLSFVTATDAMTRLGSVQEAFEEASGTSLEGTLAQTADPMVLLVMAPGDALPLWSSLLERIDQRAPVVVRSYVPRFFGVDEVAALIESSIDTAADDRFRLVVDDLTRTIVVTATPTVHDQVAPIIERLDAATPEARMQVRTIVVNNRLVEDVVALVESLLSSGMLGQSSTYLPAAEEGSDAIISGGADAELVVAADEQTSSIIAMGPPRLLDELEALVRTLDVRQAQVMLEVLMIGLSDSEARDLGIELRGQFEAGATSIALASLFGLGSSLGSGEGDGDDGGESVSGSGFTGLALRPGDFSVLIRALEQINDGRTLTMPRVLVTNNEQAVLNSVSQQPTTSINASQTVSTTSFAGFESAGTQITIRPQIAEGDHLLVEYSVSLSSFEGESSEAGVPPPRQENSIQSVATIPDGYTIVVGGIEVTIEGDGESRIPVLGRIPLVGNLFKSRSTSSSRTRFYTFIRPTVLRNVAFEDLRYISNEQLADLELDDDWPTLEPRVIR